MGKTYRVSGQVTCEVEAEGATMREALDAWSKKAGGGVPDYYEAPDGTEGGIVDRCEACLDVIREGEPYHFDEEGTCWHKRCDEDDPPASPKSETPTDPEATP